MSSAAQDAPASPSSSSSSSASPSHASRQGHHQQQQNHRPQHLQQQPPATPLGTTPAASSKALAPGSGTAPPGGPNPGPNPDPVQLASGPSTPTSSSPSKPHHRLSFPFSLPVFSPRITPSAAEGKPVSPVASAGSSASALNALRSRFNFVAPLSAHYGHGGILSRSGPGNPSSAPSSSSSISQAQPVLVRAYSPPPGTSRPGSSVGALNPVVINPGPRPAIDPLNSSSISRRRSSSVSAGGAPLTPSGAASVATAIIQRILPSYDGAPFMKMATAKSTPAGGPVDAAILPPMEAFSFKNFINNMETETDGSGPSLDSDLHRIAEICARSKYSLSNQYEVHYTPHGSGAGFLSGAPSGLHQQPPGSVLVQTSAADDEASQSSTRNRKRGRASGRWGSRAVGTTLETILSSNGSSDEDRKPKARSAAEIAADVRDRASQQQQQQASSQAQAQQSPEDQDLAEEAASTSSLSSHESSPSPEQQQQPQRPSLARKQFASAALADHDRANASTATTITTTTSEPSLPQASTSHLQMRTAPKAPSPGDHDDDELVSRQPSRVSSPAPQPWASRPDAAANLARIASRQDRVRHQQAQAQGQEQAQQQQQQQQIHPGTGTTALLSSLSGWIPWASSSSSASAPRGGSRMTTSVWGGHARSPAEGSLRDLLRGAERRAVVGG